MKDKKRPVKEEFDHFSMCNACSATECTGLITHFATDDELDAYMDVYSFQATPQKDESETEELQKNKI